MMFAMKRTEEETRSWNVLFSLYFHSSRRRLESCEVAVVVGDAQKRIPCDWRRSESDRRCGIKALSDKLGSSRYSNSCKFCRSCASLRFFINIVAAPLSRNGGSVCFLRRRRRKKKRWRRSLRSKLSSANINEVTSGRGEASVGGADRGPRRHRPFQPLIKLRRGKRPLGLAEGGGLVRPG